MPALSKRVDGVLLLLFSVACAQESVQFFYSPLLDSCEWGSSNTFPATNNTENGGLCAYISSANRLYACPAPDPTCWTWYQNCKDGTNTPSSDQILCGPSTGYQWCCASYETCTETPNQINVCVSKFASPNAGVSPADARLKEYKALPSSAVGTSIPGATPTAFSTTVFGSSTSTTSSVSSGMSATGVSFLSAAVSPSSPLSLTPTPSNTEPSLSPSPPAGGLSGGAIAGIVIGVLAGVAVLAGIVIFLFLRKRRQTASVLYEKDGQNIVPISNDMGYYAVGYKGQSAKADFTERPPQEMPALDFRQELPG